MLWLHLDEGRRHYVVMAEGVPKHLDATVKAALVTLGNTLAKEAEGMSPLPFRV